MILRSMVLEGYRSVQDALTMHFDPKVTTIIGSNDHGKSNLLRALRFLNPDVAFSSADICRATRSYDDPAEYPKVRFRFCLEQNDVSSIKKHIMEALEKRAAEPEIEGQDDQDASDEDDEDGEDEDDAEDNEDNEDGEDEDDAEDQEDDEVNDADDENEDGDEGESERIVIPIEPPLWLEDIKPGIVVEVGREGVGAQLTLFAPAVPTGEDLLLSAISATAPRVELVNNFPALTHNVTLQQLTGADFEVMQGLVKLAGLWEDRELVFSSYDTSAQARKLVQVAKDRLNRSLKSAWAQGESYDYGINISSGALHFDISDQTGHYDVPAVRGLGLLSFLEFHLTLYSRTGELAPQGFLFAFDEPGLHLHPQGQKDLLRVIEQLACRNQVAYVTHSLFLVNRNYPQRAVVVSKDSTGTHINKKPYLNNWQSVHTALGVYLADTLYYSNKVLLVEGPSDRIYLSAIMSLFAGKEDSPLDLNQFTIKDLSDDRHIAPWLSILNDEGREITLLVDNDPAGKDKAERARSWAEKCGVDVPVVFMTPASSHLSATEDLLPRGLYLRAYSEYLGDLIADGIISPAEGFDFSAIADEVRKSRAQKLVTHLLEEKLKQHDSSLSAPSKVGIARKFVQIMESEPDLSIEDKEWDTMRRIIKEIANALKLRPKADYTYEDIALDQA